MVLQGISVISRDDVLVFCETIDAQKKIFIALLEFKIKVMHYGTPFVSWLHLLKKKCVVETPPPVYAYPTRTQTNIG